MLDFELYTQKFPIVRVTCIKNPMLCNEFSVNEFSTDVFSFILTNNNQDQIKVDKFEDKIETLNRDHVYNQVDFDPESIDNSDSMRTMYLKMIKDFIEHTQLAVDSSDIEF